MTTQRSRVKTFSFTVRVRHIKTVLFYISIYCNYLSLPPPPLHFLISHLFPHSVLIPTILPLSLYPLSPPPPVSLSLSWPLSFSSLSSPYPLSLSRSPNIPTVSGSDTCSQSTASSEPWIILYRPSTISLFKKKLKNHHGDLSPLVGN